MAFDAAETSEVGHLLVPNARWIPDQAQLAKRCQVDTIEISSSLEIRLRNGLVTRDTYIIQTMEQGSLI